MRACAHALCIIQNEHVTPPLIAYDKPSESLLNFIEKHFSLTDPVWQATNYAVYEQFFKSYGMGETSPIH
jgi:alpha-tubulin N-acetyltransferase 1